MKEIQIQSRRNSNESMENVCTPFQHGATIFLFPKDEVAENKARLHSVNPELRSYNDFETIQMRKDTN